MALKILIVDDEPMIVKGLRFSLEQEGYEVDDALDGEDALQKAAATNYDLILLDVMLPKLNGMEVLRRLRETQEVPIIMLTAKGEDTDRILGLEYGADDYMVKPFNILEVKARIRTVLRRATRKAAKQATLKLRDVELDASSRTVLRGGEEINLTAKEFNLLQILMNSPNKVFSREDLLRELWKNESMYGNSKFDLRTVDVHVRRLREKLEKDPAHPEYIMTKWGVGYYFGSK